MRTAPGERARTQKGAMALVMALVIAFVLVPLTALTVDLGMQRVVRKDMQAVADTVALDLARTLGAGGTPTNAEAAQSAARNQGALGGAPALQVRVGYVSGSDAFVSDQSLGCAGQPAYNSWFRQTPPAGATANAVLVSATSGVNFAFSSGRGSACRSSIASARVEACFRLGSYAAALNSGKSALLDPIVGSLLGGSVNLTALSYQGLANASVSLLDLVSVPSLGVGTPQQLLTTTVQLRTFYLAIAHVLTQRGDTANAQVLQQIVAGLGPLSSTMIRVGDILSIDQGSQAALSTGLNLLDLVTGGLVLANGTSAIAIPGLQAKVPLLGTGLSAKLHVLEQPQMACGEVNKAKARTAQIGLDLTGSLLNTPDLGLLSLTVGQIQLKAAVAQATGTLTRVQCPQRTATNPAHQVDVQVATAGVGDVGLEVPLVVKGNLGLTTVDLRLKLATGTHAGPESALAALSLPPNDRTPVSTGSEVLLSHLGATDLTVTGGGVKLLGVPLVGTELLNWITTQLLSPILTALVQPVLNPLIDSLNSALLGPLSDLLGLNLAGADVYGVLNQDTPSCGRPKLVG